MSRWKIVVEYDGGPFVGWQRQDNGPSVQAALEAAITGFAQETVVVHGAGRTDSGVHALAQAAHFDLVREADPDRVRDALNFHLRPHPVSVLSATMMPADFHARFSAVGRRYLYRILDRRAPPSLDAGRVWHVPVALDLDAMAQAAGVLVGRHDFTSFRSVHCQAESALKTLDRLDVAREGAEIHLRLAARSFLHNQVRIIAGTLKRVGERGLAPEAVAAALAARRRAAAGPTAPPHGLYLVDVRY